VVRGSGRLTNPGVTGPVRTTVEASRREGTAVNADGNEPPDAVDEHTVHFGVGFKEQERPHVLDTLSALGPHLARWDPSGADVEVSAHDRGGKEQRVTLRANLPGLPQLVAVAADPDLTRALGEARRELIRQIDRQKSEREPMKSRQLRSQTIRHPDGEAGSSG
jgi:ribosome-associated translation inhibitor RaiA